MKKTLRDLERLLSATGDDDQGILIDVVAFVSERFEIGEPEGFQERGARGQVVNLAWRGGDIAEVEPEFFRAFGSFSEDVAVIHRSMAEHGVKVFDVLLGSFTHRHAHRLRFVIRISQATDASQQ
jgi:hypothetical protein